MPDYFDPFGEYDHIKALPMAEAIARAKEIELQVLALHAEIRREIQMQESTVDSRKAGRAKISILEDEMKFLLIRSALAS